MRYILFLLLSFLLLACNGAMTDDKNEVVQTPEILLSQEVFTNMYYDSQLTESAIRIEISKGTNTKDISRFMYQQLFEKYGVTEDVFKANLKYYASDPKLMQEIQTEVVNRLTKKETELMNQ